MNNIRQIIEERLENAQIDLKCNINLSVEDVRVLQGQIEAYQDCLNLIDEHTPKIIIKPITDEELMKAFNEKLYAPNQVIIERKPAPRTEQEILNDFEKLGYFVKKDIEYITLTNEYDDVIYIDLKDKCYDKLHYLEVVSITMQEHKLLNELFEVIFDE